MCDHICLNHHNGIYDGGYLAIKLLEWKIHITSKLVIYFFKYDFGGSSWYNSYTLFNTFGGACQILSMMILFPLLRKFFDTIRIFHICFYLAIFGYLVLLGITFTPMNNVYMLFIPALAIYSANGVMLVLTTIFLANTVDYGEYRNHRRDESVIFSMQTFVVKLASGFAALVASLALAIFHFGSLAQTGKVVRMATSSLVGLRLTMTVLPIIGLIVAIFFFKKWFILNDDYMETIEKTLKERSDDH